MKTHVEFRSSAFPAYENEEEEINPGLWGRRLAEHLKKPNPPRQPRDSRHPLAGGRRNLLEYT